MVISVIFCQPHSNLQVELHQTTDDQELPSQHWVAQYAFHQIPSPCHSEIHIVATAYGKLKSPVLPHSFDLFFLTVILSSIPLSSSIFVRMSFDCCMVMIICVVIVARGWKVFTCRKINKSWKACPILWWRVHAWTGLKCFELHGQCKLQVVGCRSQVACCRSRFHLNVEGVG